MNAREIFIVARYEFLVISRGVVFRVLTLLALLGVTWLQVALQGTGVAYSWTMVSTSSAMPLVNAYLFNIAQAFMIVFLVTDYDLREQRQGSLECIHARPVNNTDYFLGKVMAILWVFSCLGMVSGVICLAVNLFGSEAPWDPWVYLFYFLTLTFPSLLFFTGLSFLVTQLLRSRFLSQVLLLIVFYLTVTWLPGISHGSFDFMGSALANLFSDITGHSGLGFYLFQRLSILLVGAGLVCAGACQARRLPNSIKHVRGWQRVGFLFVVFGVVCVSGRSCFYFHESAVRETYRLNYERYWRDTTCRVREHGIRFSQEAGRLSSVSDMLLFNPGDVVLPRIVLYLNPGLTVSSVRVSGQDVKFIRDAQVLLIDRELGARDTVRLEISYSGCVEERYAYLWVHDHQYYNPWREDAFFNFGNRYAYVSDEFTWLVPECGWYPVSIPVNPRMGGNSGRDYTLYELEVKCASGLTVLSQGEVSREGETWRFKTPKPLEGISLCFGDYERKRVRTSGFFVELYMFRGKGIDRMFFGHLKEKDIREVLENKIGGASALTGSSMSLADSVSGIRFRSDWCYSRESRLIVAELPLSVTSFHDPRENRSGFSQPGMLFFPERGSRWEFLVPPGQNKRLNLERFDKSERKLERSVFSQLVGHLLENGGWEPLENPFQKRLFNRSFGREGFFPERQLCSGFTLMYEPGVCLSSGDYPFMDMLYKEWVRQRIGEGPWMNRGRGGKLKDVTLYAREHSLIEAMRDPLLDPLAREIYTQQKAQELLDLMCVQAPRDSLWDFFENFYKRYSGEVPVEIFLGELRDSLGVTVEDYVGWLNSRSQNVYRVKDMDIVKVQDLGRGKAYGEFKIQHCGTRRGVVAVSTDNPFTWGKQDREVYSLEPGKCYQVRFPLGQRGYRFALSTGVSRNIPTEMYVDLEREARNLMVPAWGRDTCCGVFEIAGSLFDREDDRVILVDNESPGFRLITSGRKWLQALLGKDDKPYVENLSFTNATGVWSKHYAGMYWGDSIRSVYGKLAEVGRFKAEWTTRIEREGTYEIFVFTHELDGYYREKKRRQEYFYRIEGGGCNKETSLVLLATQKGWKSLGEYHLSEGEARIVLDDRGEPGQIVIADAVKWVRVD